MYTHARRAAVGLIKGAFKRAGLRLEKDMPFRDLPRLFAMKCQEGNVSTVLDIGANVGQFALSLRAAGYRSRMVSFEPLTSAHAALCQATKGDEMWNVAPRMALGRDSRETAINIAKNLASSSLLQVKEKSIRAAPVSSFDDVESIIVRRLDDVVQEEWREPYGMKLDTQGFELQVLQGATKTLRQTSVLLTEMSLASLYEDGAKFAEVYLFLEQNGFRCIGFGEGFVDNFRNEVLQVDGIFIRESDAC